MRFRKVSVTWKDICNGQRKDSTSCPISLATKRCAKFPYVSTGDDIMYPDMMTGYVGTKLWRYKLPMKALFWYRRFDAGKAVKPFTFMLKPMEDPREA